MTSPTANAPLHEPLFVTIPDAGRMLAVRRSTIYRLIADGRLKASKLGARRLVSLDSIRELAAKLAQAE